MELPTPRDRQVVSTPPSPAGSSARGLEADHTPTTPSRERTFLPQECELQPGTLAPLLPGSAASGQGHAHRGAGKGRIPAPNDDVFFQRQTVRKC